MNEYQHDPSFDLYHNYVDSDPNLSPEVTPDPSQQQLIHPAHTEQLWEQQNATDFSQPDLSVTHDSPGYSDMEMSGTSHSHLLDSNTTDYHNQHLSPGYQQSDYSAGQNYSDGSSDLSNHNSHLLDSNYGGDLSHLQRSGSSMVTLNKLGEHSIGDIISEDGKDYKVTGYSPIHGGYDTIPVDRYPDGTYTEKGSTNLLLSHSDSITEKQKNDDKSS